MPATAASGRSTSASSRPTPTPPTFAEHVCLALVVSGVTHGWAIGSLLAPDGELGRIWSLTRPLTYRALDSLADKGLISRREDKGGGGRDRQLVEPTAEGRQYALDWLAAPVEHLRDVRTELLIKLALRQRLGLEAQPLLLAQIERFDPLIAALSVSQPDRGDLVALWRHEHARAVRRFLAQAVRGLPSATSPARTDIRISARNQLRATVDSVALGDVMARVGMVLPDGQHLSAAITRDAVDDLDLTAGDDVTVIVKSTEVMIAKEA